MAARSQTPNLDRLGLKPQNETPDGDCWFYGVARQLYGDPSMARDIRQMLAAHFDTVSRDPAQSEQFVYPNGRYNVNARGVVRTANRNMPEFGLKKGDRLPALGIYPELEMITGFRPPARGQQATPQEIVTAYANSLRSGMYAGDIESEIFSRLQGLVIRIFTRAGHDVVHTRTFGSDSTDFYRRCFPPQCINLLYNGVNHYDSLVAVPQPSAPVDPNAEAAASFGMSPNEYRAAKKAQENMEKAKPAPAPAVSEDDAAKQEFMRKFNGVMEHIRQEIKSRPEKDKKASEKIVVKLETRIQELFQKPMTKENLITFEYILKTEKFADLERLVKISQGSLTKVWDTAAGGGRAKRKTRKQRKV